MPDVKHTIQIAIQFVLEIPQLLVTNAKYVSNLVENMQSQLVQLYCLRFPLTKSHLVS